MGYPLHPSLGMTMTFSNDAAHIITLSLTVRLVLIPNFFPLDLNDFGDVYLILTTLYLSSISLSTELNANNGAS